MEEILAGRRMAAGTVQAVGEMTGLAVRKCLKRSVPTAVKNARCRFVPMVRSRSTAEIASESGTGCRQEIFPGGILVRGRTSKGLETNRVLGTAALMTSSDSWM